MKIAIMTWFKNFNYGSALQAYSLQGFLRENGQEVTLIDYSNNPDDVHKEPITGTKLFVNKVKNNLKRRLGGLYYKSQIKHKFAKDNEKKIDKFNSFLSQINFTAPVRTDEEFSALEDSFDCFICGSDQIWNPKLLNGRYYLDFVKKKPKIAYATSLSLNYIPDFSLNYIKEWIKDFKFIGIRERTGVDLITNICGGGCKNVCDPTLLMYDYWKNINCSRKIYDKYMFTYFLGQRNYYSKVIKKLKNKNSIKIVSIPMNNFGALHGDIIDYAAGVEDFVGYIKNAEFICVDSFHAVVFSVIYEKQFVVLNKYADNDLSSQNSRIRDFLAVLGLEDRIISEREVTKVEKLKNIDYVTVNEKLRKFIDSSKEMLIEAIK